jgi:hypothetical protein
VRALEGQVRLIGVDLGAGIVTPGVDEVLSGKYDKLARTVYFYVNPAMLAKATPQDNEFSNCHSTTWKSSYASQT